MANEVKIQISTTGADQASNSFRTIKRDMDSIGTSADAVGSSFSKMAGAFTVGNLLSKAIEAVVNQVQKLQQYIAESAKYAAKIETLGVAMAVVGNNAGYTSAQMKAYEEQVKKMGITTEAARNALTMMAGAQLDVSKAAQLARVAQDAAVIGGLNSSDAFARMIQGIRSGELEVLKTIGINVNFESSYRKLAQQLGTTSEKLTEQQKIMARQNAVLEYGINLQGAYDAAMGTTGKQLSSLSRYYDELKLAFGEAFAPALGALVTETTEKLKSLLKHFADNRGAYSELAKNLKDIVKSAAHPIDAVTNLIKAPFQEPVPQDTSYDNIEGARLAIRLSQIEQERIARGNSAREAQQAEAKALQAKAEALKAAAKEKAELKKYDDTRLASIAAYHDRINAITKQQSQQELSDLKARHEQGLIAERDYLEQSAVIRIKEAQQELQQLSDKNDNQFALLAKTRQSSGQNSPQYSEELTKAEKTLEAFQLAIGRLQMAEQEGTNSVATAIAKDVQNVMAAMSEKYLKDQELLERQHEALLGQKQTLMEMNGLQVEATRLTIERENAVLTREGMYTPELKTIKDITDALVLMKVAQDAAAAMTDQKSGTAILVESNPVLRQYKIMETEFKKQRKLVTDHEETLLAIREKGGKAYLDNKKNIDSRILADSERVSAMDAEYTRQSWEFKKSVALQAVDAIAGILGSMADTLMQGSQQQFEIGKKLAIAETVISTYSSAQKAFDSLAGIPYVGPVLGAAAAAAAVAAGMMRVSKIQSTSFGGGGSVSSSGGGAPSGSFASTGQAPAGGSIDNLQSPILSIRDSQTQQSFDRLTASTDNVAVAMGNLSISIDKLQNIFKTGAGARLATNLPGVGWTNPGGNSTMLAGLDIVNGGLGIGLAVKNGVLEALNWMQYDTGGGWFGGSTSNYVVNDNPALGSYITTLLQPYITDIMGMARTLGMTFDLKDWSVPYNIIFTGGRTQEQVSSDLQAWTDRAVQAMALQVEGLSSVTGAYDNAYTILKLYNDALVSTNNAFLLIGKEQLQGSKTTGRFLASVQQDLFGGQEGFTKAVDTYFKAMFTTADQDALKSVQAEAAVKKSFATINSVYPDLMLKTPETREAFRELVNSLDITTVRGAQLFAALMDVSEAFGTVQDQAQKVADANADLVSRRLAADGYSAASDLAALRTSQQQELRDFAGDTSQLLLVQQTEYKNAVKEATKSILSDANGLGAKFSSLLGSQIGVGQTLQNILTSDASGLSAAQQADNVRSLFKSTSGRAMLGDNTAMGQMGSLADQLLQVSRSSYNSAPQYWQDLNMVTDTLGRLIGLQDGQGRDIGAVTSQVATMQSMQDAITAGNLEQIEALRNIYSSTGAMQVLLTDLITEARATVAVTSAAGTATVESLTAVVDRLATIAN